MDTAQTLNYDLKHGKLADNYGLFIPDTLNTGSQISIDRISKASLRDIFFYTANVPLATKRNGKVLLGMGGNTTFNAVFGTNTQEVCQELIDSRYILLNEAKKDLILRLEKSGEVKFIDPKYLRLDGKGMESRYFLIRTGFYSKDVTPTRKSFVSAGYASGRRLGNVMDTLRSDRRITAIMIYTMNPDDAAEKIKDGEIVARASRLSGFSGGCDFDANFCDVNSTSALRGILRNSVESDSAPTKTLEHVLD